MHACILKHVLFSLGVIKQYFMAVYLMLVKFNASQCYAISHLLMIACLSG